jgi:hypothetical protein
MRDLHEVLRQKEMDLARVRQEVEALRYVAPLLFEAEDQPGSPDERSWSAAPKNRWPLELEQVPRVSSGF